MVISNLQSCIIGACMMILGSGIRSKGYKISGNIAILIGLIGIPATILYKEIYSVFTNLSGYWFLIPGIIIFFVGIAGIINIVLRRTWRVTGIFNHFKKLFTKQHTVLSASMRNIGNHSVGGKDFLSWALVVKLHIITTRPNTILFKKCTAELKHKQYKDIQSDFSNIVLIEEEYRNNEVPVLEKFKKPKFSQIVIDRPSTVTLLAMLNTSVWIPGGKECIELLFKLPVSEMNYKPIKISVEMSRTNQGIDFATIT